MYLSILIAILFCTTIVSSDDDEEKAADLCADPIIHTAHRLVNNSVRIYRDNYYWELIGLPDREGHLDGPHKIWYPNLGPVNKNTSIMTGLSGQIKGVHYKFLGNHWWSWYDNGVQRSGAKNGDWWPGIPNFGFTAAYHDGNSSGLGVPLMVAFSGIKVYYYNCYGFVWLNYGSADGFIGGQYGENFPPDITSSFSYPSDDPKVKYFVYLFKRDKHCFRPWKLKSGKDCDEWRDNRVLFGCSKGSGSGGGNGGGNGGGAQPYPQPPEGGAPAVTPTTQRTPETTSFGLKSQISLVLFLASIISSSFFK